MKKLLVGGFLTLVLIGCSTRPPAEHEIKQVPEARIFNHQAKLDNNATLVFIRDEGLTGSGCYINLFLNGQEVAKFETKERATFYLPAGEVIIGASIQGHGLCSFNAPRRERDFNLNNNEKKIFRLFIDQNGNTDIIPTTLYQ